MRFFIDNARFLAFAWLMCIGSTFGQTHFFGVFQADISAAYGLTPSGFGTLYLGATLAGAVGLNMVGHLVDRMALSSYVIVLWVLLLTGCLLVAVAQPLWLFALSIGMVRLTGQGLMTHAATTAMSRYFEAERGRAVSVAGMGLSLGRAVFPVLTVALLSLYDWRTLWIGMPLALILPGLPLSLWLLKGQKARHSAWLAAQKADIEALEDGTASPRASVPSKKRKDMLRDPALYMALPAGLTLPFWVTGFFFFADQMAGIAGLPLAAYAGQYWIYVLVAALVPLYGGELVDRYGPVKMLCISPLSLMIAALVLAVMPSKLGFKVFFIVLGLAGGLTMPVSNALWARLFGTRYLGEVKALTSSLLVFTTALAPAVIGVLLDMGISMASIVLFGSVFWSVAALVAWAGLLRHMESRA